MDSTDALIAERAKTHGDFGLNSQVSQNIKNIIRAGLVSAGKELSNAEMEALDMIAHKIGRIVAGDNKAVQHWEDLAGYPRIVELRMKNTYRAITQEGAAVAAEAEAAVARSLGHSHNTPVDDGDSNVTVTGKDGTSKTTTVPAGPVTIEVAKPGDSVLDEHLN